MLSTCEQLGIGFVPWSLLGMGYLTGARAVRPGLAPRGKAVDRAIPGTTKLAHLEENLGATRLKLTADDRREIRAAFSNIRLVDVGTPDSVRRDQ